MTPGWKQLETELDAWAESGREALIWWRDDDAVAATPALTRLLDLAAATTAPLALAVIPARAQPSLAAALRNHPAETAVLQHGYAHDNHAGAAAKKCELVSPAARPGVIEELRRGREILSSLVAPRCRPVLVPPWNRLADDLVARLPGLGFTGLSTYAARPAAAPQPGLHQVNCHVDILQWRPERRFLGTAAALDLLVGHLAAKRRGTADPDEPSGLLSHHLVHDTAAWEFLDRLLRHLVRHPAARLLPATEVFAGSPANPVRREAGR